MKNRRDEGMENIIAKSEGREDKRGRRKGRQSEIKVGERQEVSEIDRRKRYEEKKDRKGT